MSPFPMARRIACGLAILAAVATEVGAQSCGVTAFAEFMTVSTNRVKTGELGLCLSSPPPTVERIYRTVSRNETYHVTYGGGSSYSTKSFMYVTTYEMDGYGVTEESGPDGCLEIEAVTTSISYGDIEAKCYAYGNGCYSTWTNGVWTDGGLCDTACGAIGGYGLSTNVVLVCDETYRDERTTGIDWIHAQIDGRADEYTTPELIQKWTNDLAGLTWPTNWSCTGAARRLLSNSERCVDGDRLKYRIKFMGRKGQQRR